MLDALIRWSLERRAFVVFLSVAFLVYGAYIATQIPLDVLPDLTAPTVTVLVEGRGMAPAEMESLVTFPIESAVNGSAGVRRVRSATSIGIAIIWVEFEWGQDIQRARQVVNERLSQVSNLLPPQASAPFLAPISSIMGEIMFISLTSDQHDELTLRTTADAAVRRRLLAVPGVSQVIPTGGGQKQYQVLVDARRLLEYELSLQEVEGALERANQNASAGFHLAGGQEYLIQGLGRVKNVEEIGAIAITARQSRPIYIRDVADVRVGPALKRGLGSHNGSPAVIMGIQKQPGANTLTLTRQLDATLDDIQRTLPAGMKIDKHIFRQSDFIERSLSNLFLALRDGVVLVLIIVVLFLFNARAAAITLSALPLSIVAAVLALSYFGLTINTMTLGGLAIAIGELVDDAIIDVENVVRRLRENARKETGERRPALEVVYRASSEIRSSVVFATIIVVLVFLPLFALTSVEGRLLKPLGFAYVISLGASLVVALTVTPALCLYLLPGAKSIREGHEPWLAHQLKRIYRPMVEWSMRHVWAVIAVAVLGFAAAGLGLAGVGRTFLPDFNEGALTVSAVTLPGTSLTESDQLGAALERVMLSVPEVVSTGRRTGRAELDEHVQGVESAEIDVKLNLAQRSKDEVLADLRRKVKLIPGMNIEIGQPISHRIDHMLSGTRANIAIKIFGDDLAQLRLLAQRVKAAVDGTPGVVDLNVEQQTDVPQFQVRVNPESAARYGLPAGQVATLVRTAFAGREVNRVFEGQLSFPLVVKYAREDAGSLDEVRRTLFDTPSGARIPLAALATLEPDAGPNFIMRESGQRRIVVSCNTAGRDLLGAVEEIGQRVGKSVPMPAGYRVEYGGQFQAEQEASRRILVLSALVIAGMFIILAGVFRSVPDALLILLNLPFALVGGVAGVYWGGGVLSVASLIGFITLFGIASRNGIMLISHIQHLREQEDIVDLWEAVCRGAEERVVPILMTALAAGLALIPIAAGAGQPGSEIQAPMAFVILFGLLTSTVLNMFVVPSMYVLVHGRRVRPQ
jgi:CzcA family heavy metal efflux pump